MRRSVDDLLRLVDVLQLVLVVAALVTLALPWWDYVDGDDGVTRTGWAALKSGEYGYGWAVLIVLAVTSAATVVRLRWAAIVGIVVGALGFLLMVFGASRVQSVANHGEHAHAGLWVGAVLVLIAVANQVGLAALRRPR